MHKTWLRIIILIMSYAHNGILMASDQAIQYLFPKPGSTCLPAGTENIIRFNQIRPEEIVNLDTFIQLSGNQSGVISGKTTILSDHKTIRCLPDQAYQCGEIVTVSIRPCLEHDTNPFVDSSYTFTVYDQPECSNPDRMQKRVAESRPVFDYSSQNKLAQDPVILNGVSIPSNFPRIRILLSDNPADGLIFMNHGRDISLKVHMIFDNAGNPVWYSYSDHWDPRNFRMHKNGAIAMNVYHPRSFGEGYISMDNTYTPTDSFWVDWNGYAMDDHELTILEDGSYFMVGYKNYYHYDMSQHVPEGNPDMTVRECAIFGYPPGSHDPNFIWRAFDNFNVWETDDPGLSNDLTANSIRFPHMNAIDADTDGNILLSSRHLSEITKIDAATGDKIWRLGGLHNQFTFINDPFEGPANQHDIRPMGNNRYTVFDNGNQHTPRISRAVEWEVDTTAMTATVTWEYQNVEESNRNYSDYMGNHQVLPNGNRMINWAASRRLSKLATEVTADGTKTLEFEFEDDSDVYRILKHQWVAVAAVPYLVVEVHTDAVTLIFNKFGDSNVDYYKIYGGTQPGPTTVIATSEEPFVHLTTELVNNRRNYFRVTAVDQSGHESGFSNQEHARISLIEPGENMVVNGDFSHGFAYWDWLVRSADADYEITGEEELHFIIRDGGGLDWNVQALYPGISLIQDNEYRLEFDAYAAQSRIVYFDVRKDGDPYTNFSQIGGTVLSPSPHHYSYVFTMADPSETEARIVLNAGAYDSDVYVDNVSLVQVDPNAVDQEVSIPNTFKLDQNYPNPFNPQTTICFNLQNPDHVTLKIYDIKGREITTLTDGYLPAGKHELNWDASEQPSGLYFYVLQAGDYSVTQKMVVQK